jgi:peptide deformylase
MKVSSKIVQIDDKKDNPLRIVSSPVKKNEFGTDELKNTIKAMQEALAKEDDGVAIAAPQIGVNKCIFIISEKSYDKNAKWKPLIFINPKITKASKRRVIAQEGCLSVRWIYGSTERSTNVTIEAYDINGNKFSYGAGGLIAHIFQHETDHLEGVLFTDHGFDFEEFTEEEVKAANKK